jgi:rhodanese-related sulfurtransferase
MSHTSPARAIAALIPAHGRPMIAEMFAPVRDGRPPRRLASGATRRETMFRKTKPVRNLDVDEVARGLAENRILLVDVREPNETALEAFPGAVLVPLSSFDPARIPDPEGREVVFACRSGRRSVTASQAAQAAGLPYDAHLAGGILAWKAAGHPTES